MKEIGLWIDHRKTVIVTIENETAMTREIKSNMEKHVKFSSGTRSKAPQKPQGSTAEDTRDRQFGNHLGRYYEGIVSIIRDAEAIWIFGPGEAKIELQNCLKREGLGEHIVGIETVDKMSDQQISSKVQGRFLRY